METAVPPPLDAPVKPTAVRLRFFRNEGESMPSVLLAKVVIDAPTGGQILVVVGSFDDRMGRIGVN
jgi:hypothetical protein